VYVNTNLPADGPQTILTRIKAIAIPQGLPQIYPNRSAK
jgi:hypothetical protein